MNATTVVVETDAPRKRVIERVVPLSQEQIDKFMSMLAPDAVYKRIEEWPTHIIDSLLKMPDVWYWLESGKRLLGMWRFTDGPVCADCRRAALFIALTPRANPEIIENPVDCECGARRFVYQNEAVS